MGRYKDELVKREQALVAAAKLAGRQCVVCTEVIEFDDLEADLHGDKLCSGCRRRLFAGVERVGDATLCL